MKVLPYIAAGMLVLAVIAHTPYGFFQLLRWVVTIAAGMLAGNSQGWQKAVLIGFAILFNPIIPIHFERGTWQTLDIAAAAALIVLRKPANTGDT